MIRKTVAGSSEPKVTGSTTPTKRHRRPSSTTTLVNSRHPPVTKQSNITANTPLRVPYGNKEIAQQLGGRYGAGGWYAPHGVI